MNKAFEFPGWLHSYITPHGLQPVSLCHLLACEDMLHLLHLLRIQKNTVKHFSYVTDISILINCTMCKDGRIRYHITRGQSILCAIVSVVNSDGMKCSGTLSESSSWASMTWVITCLNFYHYVMLLSFSVTLLKGSRLTQVIYKLLCLPVEQRCLGQDSAAQTSPVIYPGRAVQPP